MLRIDQMHLARPFADTRMLRHLLRAEGHATGRMCIEVLHQKLNTRQRKRSDEVNPCLYLSPDMAIERPSQAWAADITYIPVRRGFLYLFAVIDRYPCRAQASRLSKARTTAFCLDAGKTAIRRHGRQETFNTEQGHQLTKGKFTDPRKTHGIPISMDGKGCWRDNTFVERPWKSITRRAISRPTTPWPAPGAALSATSAARATPLTVGPRERPTSTDCPRSRRYITARDTQDPQRFTYPAFLPSKQPGGPLLADLSDEERQMLRKSCRACIVSAFGMNRQARRTEQILDLP